MPLAIGAAMLDLRTLLAVTGSLLLAGPALPSSTPLQGYEGTGSTFGGRPPGRGDTIPPLIGPADQAPP